MERLVPLRSAMRSVVEPLRLTGQCFLKSSQKVSRAILLVFRRNSFVLRFAVSALALFLALFSFYEDVVFTRLPSTEVLSSSVAYPPGPPTESIVVKMQVSDRVQLGKQVTLDRTVIVEPRAHDDGDFHGFAGYWGYDPASVNEAFNRMTLDLPIYFHLAGQPIASSIDPASVHMWEDGKGVEPATLRTIVNLSGSTQSPPMYAEMVKVPISLNRTTRLAFRISFGPAFFDDVARRFFPFDRRVLTMYHLAPTVYWREVPLGLPPWHDILFFVAYEKLAYYTEVRSQGPVEPNPCSAAYGLFSGRLTDKLLFPVAIEPGKVALGIDWELQTLPEPIMDTREVEEQEIPTFSPSVIDNGVASIFSLEMEGTEIPFAGVWRSSEFYNQTGLKFWLVLQRPSQLRAMFHVSIGLAMVALSGLFVYSLWYRRSAKPSGFTPWRCYAAFLSTAALAWLVVLVSTTPVLGMAGSWPALLVLPVLTVLTPVVAVPGRLSGVAGLIVVTTIAFYVWL